MIRHLLLVDGSNLFARAWFTLREPAMEAMPTKVRSMLASAIRRWEPTHLVVALDSPDPVRRRLIPGYKAERDDRRRGPSTEQITEALRPSFAAWNVAVREAPGMEADDVIASLARRSVQIGIPASILSRDTDLLQLVDDDAGVRVLWPEGSGAGEMVLDLEETRRYLLGHRDFQAAIGPTDLLDLRTMAGGKDGLPRIEIRGPGVKPPYGFTTRRAAELLAAGETLDSLLERGRDVLSDREWGWMQVCRESALERRENLRLRDDLEPTGHGASAIANQAWGGEIVPRPQQDQGAPAPVSAAGEGIRTEAIKVLCAGGCGRMESCEPYHDPEAVYCIGCGIASSRAEARQRRLQAVPA